jgi:DegV family protein with EDD domain
MAIKIVTDSVSDIPKESVERYGITVLPLTVNFQDGSYRDGVDLSPESFFNKLKQASKMPTTSQVPPGEFLETFEELVKDGHQVIGVFMSSKLSGTYQSAMTARDMLGVGNIAVLDSQMISYGFGQVVVAIAKLAQKGHDFDKLIELAQEMIDKSTCRFIVDTLEYLTKGGRLKPAEAMVGNLLNIKPILTMTSGELKSFSKARGRKKAVRLVLDDLKSRNIDLNHKHVAFFHAVDREYLQEFYEVVHKEYPHMIASFSQVGCVVGTHSGPSCIALSYIDIPNLEI